MNKEKYTLDVKSRFATNLLKGVIISGAAFLLAGTLSVPFYYETQTLWYKFGADRVMLLTGQMAGLLTLFLLMGQLLLALRVHFFELLFGGANLLRWHRMNGVLIICIAFGHILLVLAPEGLDNLPIGEKYWPEMIGALLFLFLFLQMIALSSRFRSWFGLQYARWRKMHKLIGYFSLALVFVHVLFVSESFSQGFPRLALVTAGTGLALLTGVIKVVQRPVKNKGANLHP